MRPESGTRRGTGGWPDRLAAITRGVWILGIVGWSGAAVWLLLIYMWLTELTRQPLHPALLGWIGILVIQVVVGVAVLAERGRRQSVIPVVAVVPVMAAWGMLFAAQPNLQVGVLWSAAGFAVAAVLSALRLWLPSDSARRP